MLKAADDLWIDQPFSARANQTADGRLDAFTSTTSPVPRASLRLWNSPREASRSEPAAGTCAAPGPTNVSGSTDMRSGQVRRMPRAISAGVKRIKQGTGRAGNCEDRSINLVLLMAVKASHWNGAQPPPTPLVYGDDADRLLDTEKSPAAARHRSERRNGDRRPAAELCVPDPAPLGLTHPWIGRVSYYFAPATAGRRWRHSLWDLLRGAARRSRRTLTIDPLHCRTTDLPAKRQY